MRSLAIERSPFPLRNSRKMRWIEMSATVSLGGSRQVDSARTLSALIAAIVIVDTIVVQAPGLGLLAVPFVVAALAFRRRRVIPTVLLLLWATFFVFIGVAFAASNGFDAGWGDLLFAYVGTPASAALLVILARQLAGRRSSNI